MSPAKRAPLGARSSLHRGAEPRASTARPGARALGLARWDDLRFFLAVLRAGSFSAAARKLEVEQSTVSRRIAALEHELGALLFDRLKEGPRPTELSLRLQSRAEAIEAEVWALADAGRGESRVVEGTVRLALTDSFAVQVIIPEVLAELTARHPQLRLELLSSDHTADLGRREADLALRFYRPSSGDLVVKRLAQLPLAVLAHQRYLRAVTAASGTSPRPQKGASKQRPPRSSRLSPRELEKRAAKLDLTRLDWVSLRIPGVPSLDAELLARVSVAPRLTVSSHIAQVEAVRAGLGVALLTRALCKLDRNLVELPLGLAAAPPVELWLVCPRPLRAVPRVAAVWDLLEQRLSALSEQS